MREILRDVQHERAELGMNQSQLWIELQTKSTLLRTLRRRSGTLALRRNPRRTILAMFGVNFLFVHLSKFGRRQRK